MDEESRGFGFFLGCNWWIWIIIIVIVLLCCNRGGFRGFGLDEE